MHLQPCFAHPISTATVTLPATVLTVNVDGAAVTPDASKHVTVSLDAIGIAEVEVQDAPWTVGLGVGLSNQGLVVRTTGKVTPIGSQDFFIDDGSQAWIKVALPAGVTPPPAGFRVAVTGISACERVGNSMGQLLNVRTASDVTIVGGL